MIPSFEPPSPSKFVATVKITILGLCEPQGWQEGWGLFFCVNGMFSIPLVFIIFVEQQQCNITISTMSETDFKTMDSCFFFSTSSLLLPGR